MKDLAKFFAKRSPTQTLILAAVALLVLFAAGRSTARVEGHGPVSSSGQALPGSTPPTPNPVNRREPIRSFVCLSSWYGGHFDGQLTANGEIYDMYGQTAAHPSLPLGSVVRVMNLRTRKSAIVRINDRGPYVPGRDLDVSYQVARELGFVRRGTARVRVELLKVPSSKAMHSAN
ncbi:MAG: septal ring lytic transglycosylase RlpA family protein [Candidatus Dormibacteraceae bacterium]